MPPTVPRIRGGPWRRERQACLTVRPPKNIRQTPRKIARDPGTRARQWRADREMPRQGAALLEGAQGVRLAALGALDLLDGTQRLIARARLLAERRRQL